MRLRDVPWAAEVEVVVAGNGWYSLPVAWAARSRRDSARPALGEAVNFWGAEQLERPGGG